MSLTQPEYKPCTKVVCGSCSILKVKCLERRFLGGVKFGECGIREPKGLQPFWPSYNEKEMKGDI